MKTNSSSRSLSSLAMAGLAAGLLASSVWAEDASKDATSCKGHDSCKGMKAPQVDTSSCAGNGKCGGMAPEAAAPVDSAKASILSAKTAKQFKKACKAAGKSVSKATCAGKNSCKGVYFVGEKASEVACKGHASCHGLKCDI